MCIVHSVSAALYTAKPELESLRSSSIDCRCGLASLSCCCPFPLTSSACALAFIAALSVLQAFMVSLERACRSAVMGTSALHWALRTKLREAVASCVKGSMTWEMGWGGLGGLPLDDSLRVRMPSSTAATLWITSSRLLHCGRLGRVPSST